MRPRGSTALRERVEKIKKKEKKKVAKKLVGGGKRVCAKTISYTERVQESADAKR